MSGGRNGIFKDKKGKIRGKLNESSTCSRPVSSIIHGLTRALVTFNVARMLCLNLHGIAMMHRRPKLKIRGVCDSLCI